MLLPLFHIVTALDRAKSEVCREHENISGGIERDYGSIMKQACVCVWGPCVCLSADHGGLSRPAVPSLKKHMTFEHLRY